MTYNTTVSAETVQQHLNDPDWVVFDCHFFLGSPEAGRAAYQKGHIPGARFMDMDTDLSASPGPADGRHPLPDPQTFIGKLRDWGVNNHSQVVFYDGDKGPFAARGWWTLQWLGHEKTAVLEGGLASWKDAGYTVSTDDPECSPGSFSGTPNPDMVVEVQEVEEMLRKDRVSLLDARPNPRYQGEGENIDPYGGHIPGSLSCFWGGNVDENNRFLSPEALRQRFAPMAEKEIVHSCGSGVTACHNVLAMDIAGFSRPRLYVGSWSEWIRSEERPRASGSEPGKV